MSASYQVHSFSDVVRILRKHWLKSACIAVMMLALAFLVILFAPRKYLCYAQYLVRLGRESVALDPTATVGETMGLYMTNDSVVKSTREIIGSETVARRVVQKMGPETILEVEVDDSGEEPGLIGSTIGSAVGAVKESISSIDPISIEEKATIKFRESLNISSPTQSNIIMVNYTAESPQHAFDVMNVVSEVFLEEHRRVNRTDGSFEFFEEQNVILQEKIVTASEAMKSAKQRFGIVSVEGKKKDLESQLNLAETSKYEIERRLAVSQARIKSVEAQLASTPEEMVLSANSGEDQQSAAAVRQQFYALQVQEKELASTHQPSHPDLVGIREQLADVEKIFRSMNLSQTQTSRGTNPIHQNLTLQLLKHRADEIAFQAEAEVVDNQLSSLNESLQELASQEQEIFQLQTRLDVARAKYEAHAGKMEQARLDNELSDESISSLGVVEQPIVNERPVSPNKKLVALLGIVAAFGSAFCLPFLIEYLRYDPLNESFGEAGIDLENIAEGDFASHPTFVTQATSSAPVPATRSETVSSVET